MDFIGLTCSFCIFPIAILIIFGAVIGIIYYDRRKHTEAWQEAAQRAGLTFHAPSWILGRPTLSGEWHGRPLRVYTVTRGTPGTSGGTRTTMYIEMSASLPAGARLDISERNIFSLLDLTGGETVTNDADFDQRFVLRGEPPEFARRALAFSGLRRLLLQARYANFEAAGERIRYRQPNVEIDVGLLLFYFALLFDLAETIERA
jgi:hypothetical protein